MATLSEKEIDALIEQKAAVLLTEEELLGGAECESSQIFITP